MISSRELLGFYDVMSQTREAVDEKNTNIANKQYAEETGGALEQYRCLLELKQQPIQCHEHSIERLLVYIFNDLIWLNQTTSFHFAIITGTYNTYTVYT